MLNNFLFWAELDPASPVVIAPNKRMGTRMAPVAILRDEELFAMLGTPGSFGIPQTTTQMISNLIDHEFNIQAAIEAPRIRTYAGTTIDIEDRVPEAVRAELTRRGHDLRLIGDWSAGVGGGQGFMIDPDSGALLGGADPRRDGYAIAF
jgi:gamma-glutamyltranspeptidase/glutathione hydrolase